MKNSRTNKRRSHATKAATTARSTADGVNFRQNASEAQRRAGPRDQRKNMTASEVAEELDIRPGRVYAMVRDGSEDCPPYFKLGKTVRFPRAEFRAWRAARIVGAVAGIAKAELEDEPDAPKRLL